MCRSLYARSIPAQMLPHAPTREFSHLNAGASAGFFVGWSCTWHLVNDRKSACATLPKQQKSTWLPRVTTHAYAGCKISGQHPTKFRNNTPRWCEVSVETLFWLLCCAAFGQKHKRYHPRHQSEIFNSQLLGEVRIKIWEEINSGFEFFLRFGWSRHVCLDYLPRWDPGCGHENL